jgi:cation diffusion facilitator CzcD-associated flavoprotein CzcO
MTGHARKLDILVISAGQAGLAPGFHLKKTPFRFQLVERNARVGEDAAYLTEHIVKRLDHMVAP